MTLKNLGELSRSMQLDIEKFPFRDILLPSDFKDAYAEFLNKDSPDGYQSVIWGVYTARILSSSNKSIYLPNYWFYVASQLANLFGALEEHKSVFLQIFNLPTDKKDQIAGSLRVSDAASGALVARIESFFESGDFGADELDWFKKFVSDYSVWGGGKSIDRQDYFVSPILKAGNLLAETQSAVAEIAKQLAKNSELWSLLKGKVELINLAPSILNTDLSGFAPIIYQRPAPLPKPFLLLAGISGTGKTQFVRRQAAAVRPDLSNYCLVPVRPDWHEPSDLLGYVTRIGGEGYVPTAFLKFMVDAWCDAYERIENDKLILRPLDKITTFWACLDEMNLAPVEQYFADYLSVLETRRWDGQRYTCDPLVHPARLLQDPSSLSKLQASLGLDGRGDLWDHFVKFGIPLPPNLIVAGTVNMDETAHGFSRKVIDRAFTVDFGEFFANDFDRYFLTDRNPKLLQYSRYSYVLQADLLSVPADPDGAKSVAFLKAINQSLLGSPFEVAFRALNELLLAVRCFAPADQVALEAVWDDFLMTKLLPRIEGDSEKLRADGETSLLTRLRDSVSDLLVHTIHTGVRPDLLQIDVAGEIVHVPLRSIKKINWMQDRLIINAFTSFWP